MKKTIRIGEKEVELEAVATLPIIMKRLFGINILTDLEGITKSGIKNDEIVETISKLAFVMAMQSKLKEPKKILELNDNDFLMWLSQFEPLDIAYSGEEIVGVYTHSKKNESNVKNPESLQ